jgi:hypothetical protein
LFANIEILFVVLPQAFALAVETDFQQPSIIDQVGIVNWSTLNNAVKCDGAVANSGSIPLISNTIRVGGFSALSGVPTNARITGFYLRLILIADGNFNVEEIFVAQVGSAQIGSLGSLAIPKAPATPVIDINVALGTPLNSAPLVQSALATWSVVGFANTIIQFRALRNAMSGGSVSVDCAAIKIFFEPMPLPPPLSTTLSTSSMGGLTLPSVGTSIGSSAGKFSTPSSVLVTTTPIVSIGTTVSPDSTTAALPMTPAAADPSAALIGGAIGGGVVALLVLIGCLIAWLLRRRRTRTEPAPVGVDTIQFRSARSSEAYTPVSLRPDIAPDNTLYNNLEMTTTISQISRNKAPQSGHRVFGSEQEYERGSFAVEPVVVGYLAAGGGGEQKRN